MCLVYNIIYQILSKQSATPMKYFTMLQSPGHHLIQKLQVSTMKNNLCCHCSWGAHHFNLGMHPFQSTWLAKLFFKFSCGACKREFTFWVWVGIRTNSASSLSLAGRLVHWATESLKDMVTSYIRFFFNTRPALSARTRNVTSVLYETKTW